MTDPRRPDAYRTLPERPRRAAHPARSARILSTGLAATATFGLISGYAYAAHSTTDTGTNNGLSPVSPTSPVDGAATGVETPTVDVQSQSPSSVAPQAPANVQPSPVVIEVPAPAPAAPASGGGGGSGQSSSGSR